MAVRARPSAQAVVGAGESLLNPDYHPRFQYRNRPHGDIDGPIQFGINARLPDLCWPPPRQHNCSLDLCS